MWAGWRRWSDGMGRDLAAGARRTSWDNPSGTRWLLTAALVASVLGAFLYLACGYEAGFMRWNAAAATLPGEFWAGLTMLGDERVVAALALLFAWRYPRLFWALILAAVVAALYSRGLKALVMAPRPPAILPPESFQLIGPGHRRASFPSGHSTVIGVLVGVLVHDARARLARPLLLGLAAAVAFSRVAVGVHWPVDILFGLAGGLLAAWVGVWLAARWPTPATQVPVHLALIAVAASMTTHLWFDDGGYASAATGLRLLAALSLAMLLYVYALRPWWRGGEP